MEPNEIADRIRRELAALRLDSAYTVSMPDDWTVAVNRKGCTDSSVLIRGGRVYEYMRLMQCESVAGDVTVGDMPGFLEYLAAILRPGPYNGGLRFVNPTELRLFLHYTLPDKYEVAGGPDDPYVTVTEPGVGFLRLALNDNGRPYKVKPDGRHVGIQGDQGVDLLGAVRRTMRHHTAGWQPAAGR